MDTFEDDRRRIVPEVRWLDDAESDLRKTGDDRRWHKAENRDEWQSLF